MGPEGLQGEPGPQGPAGVGAAEAAEAPAIPFEWISVTPEHQKIDLVLDTFAEITAIIKTAPGATVTLTFINPETGTRSRYSPSPGVSDADGMITLVWTPSKATKIGEATMEVVVTLGDDEIMVTKSYTIDDPFK